LLFNFSLHYAIRQVQENKEELEVNGTYQFLIYIDSIIFSENKCQNEKQELHSMLLRKLLMELPSEGAVQQEGD